VRLKVGYLYYGQRHILILMDSLREEIRALERALLQPEVRRSAARLDDLLADSFREIGSSGKMFTRADILEALPTETGEVAFVMSDFEIVRLSADVVLATYAVARTTGSQTTRSLRSSIWTRTGGGWRMRFHQGTNSRG
jgi:glyoxylase I family protein